MSDYFGVINNHIISYKYHNGRRHHDPRKPGVVALRYSNSTSGSSQSSPQAVEIELTNYTITVTIAIDFVTAPAMGIANTRPNLKVDTRLVGIPYY